MTTVETGATSRRQTRARIVADTPTKAERTRSAIIDAALEQFREAGYEDATMRAIAARAGVSVGNAYYYFASKEHLIQGFYDRAGEEHRERAARLLASETDLSARVAGVLHAWIDTMGPYHAFAGVFFRNAAEPTSPLSPFSAESAPARDAAIEMWRDVVERSDTRVPKALRADLPELLWLYSMGVVLFWVHDPSADTARTRRLIDRSVPVVVRAIGLARVPVLRATIVDLIALVDEIKTL